MAESMEGRLLALVVRALIERNSSRLSFAMSKFSNICLDIEPGVES
jgi:hypothetical protein